MSMSAREANASPPRFNCQPRHHLGDHRRRTDGGHRLSGAPVAEPVNGTAVAESGPIRIVYLGCCWAGDTGESGQRSESVVGSGPMCAYGVDAGAADDATQDGGDDDGVVGVAEDPRHTEDCLIVHRQWGFETRAVRHDMRYRDLLLQTEGVAP